MRPDPSPSDAFTLSQARVHEAEGRGRRAFALFQAARHLGPLVWIQPTHAPEMPMLRGLPRGVGERLHLLRPSRELDLLWCVEETLRAAPVARVIAEPEQPLSLIAGRRLQLAAEAGRTTGLMLICVALKQPFRSRSTQTKARNNLGAKLVKLCNYADQEYLTAGRYCAR